MKKEYQDISYEEWVDLPLGYIKLIKDEKFNLGPWWLSDSEDITWRIDGLRKRYPNRVLFPFARNDYNDDVACWDKNQPGKVIIIMDFEGPGHELGSEFKSFDAWLDFAIHDEVG